MLCSNISKQAFDRRGGGGSDHQFNSSWCKWCNTLNLMKQFNFINKVDTTLRWGWLGVGWGEKTWLQIASVGWGRGGGEDSTDYSRPLPSFLFFFFFFFFKKISLKQSWLPAFSSRAPVPLFRSGSVNNHSSASWDHCGQVFPDELRVSSFSTLCLDIIVNPLRNRWVRDVYVLKWNLPPALLAEWPGSFTCHCGNTGWNGHRIRVSTES